MHRRSFLVRSGLAAVGTVLFPVLIPVAPLRATVGSAGPTSGQLTDGDRALLGLLSAYGTDIYFWGGQVYTRALNAAHQDGTTRLLVQVSDENQLVTFLNSGTLKTLGTVRATGNILSFAYQGTAYEVTNADPDTFAEAVAEGVVSRQAVSDGSAALFTPETLLYHPATDSLVDSHLALHKRHVELAETPAGGIKARFQTLLHGMLTSKQYGLKLGKKFTAFQSDLLGSEPTAKAGRKIVQILLQNISLLAASFDVASLAPLITSPLVSASLESVLGLDATAVLAQVEKLRAELASGDYSDAALWLAALLGTQIQNGTAGEWINLLSANAAAATAARTALSAAAQLVGATGSGSL